MSADYRESVRTHRGVLEKIVSYVPLYHGYKEKELRREADKLLRGKVHREMEDAKSYLRMVRKLAVEIQPPSVFASVDSVVNQLDTSSQRINRAILGYSGFFNAVKIGEDELDRLYSHDLRLLETATALSKACSDFSSKAGTLNPEEIAKETESIRHSIDQFDKTFKGRTSILSGG